MKTTIHKFFSWYAGSQRWLEDNDVTNTLTIGNKYSQDDGNNGRKILEALHAVKDQTIDVETRDGGNAFDLTFEFNKVNYAIQSTKNFEEEMKDKYSLNSPYFCKYYDTIDDLCDDVASSGMDPNCNITFEGKDTNETAWDHLKDYV